MLLLRRERRRYGDAAAERPGQHATSAHFHRQLDRCTGVAIEDLGRNLQRRQEAEATADFAGGFKSFSTLHLLQQRPFEFFAAWNQVVLFEDSQVRQRRRAAGSVPGVGRAVAEGRRVRVIPKR